MEYYHDLSFVYILSIVMTIRHFFFRTVTINLKRSKDSGGREKSIIFKLEDRKELTLRPSKTPGAKPGSMQLL